MISGAPWCLCLLVAGVGGGVQPTELAQRLGVGCQGRRAGKDDSEVWL